MMKSWAWASSQAASISAWVASARPHSRFSRIVPEKSVLFCSTTPMAPRRPSSVIVAHIDAVHQDRAAP